MSYKDSICPYIVTCKKFRNGDCHNKKRFKECGEYEDFELYSSGMHDSVCKFVLEKLGKSDKRQIKHKKRLNKKCPLKPACYHTFIKPCNMLRSNSECYPYKCEDCELNIRDYGEYCDTAEYEQCKTYESIFTIKETLEVEGVHNTEDLKKFYGKENYNWLGGYIRAAFMELVEIG